jgi:hypothetical protein
VEGKVGFEVTGEELGPGAFAFAVEKFGGDVGALSWERYTSF